MSTELTFDRLVGAIEDVHAHLSRQAKAAVNMSLTLRNWLIGAWLVEYEQGGADRATYGAQLVDRVAERLGATVAQVAQAWILAQPEITCVISGADTPEQLADNLGSLELTIPAEEMAVLNRVSAGLSLVLDGSDFESDR